MTDKKKRSAQQLDDAVDMTFPASDPTAVGNVTGTEPSKRPIDRKPPRITREQIEAAERDEGHSYLDVGSKEAKKRRQKHHGLADEGLHSADETKPTVVKDHAGLGRAGSKGD